MGASAVRTLLGKLLEVRPSLELLHEILRFILGLYKDVTRVDFLLGLKLPDLLVIGGPSLRVAYAAADLLLVEGVAHGAQLVIGEAVLEVLAGGKLALIGLIREKMRLDEIFHEHATAALRGKARNLGSNLGFREGELGVCDVGSIDFGNRPRIGDLYAKRQRESANA
jgi:hypothetical protein